MDNKHNDKISEFRPNPYARDFYAMMRGLAQDTFGSTDVLIFHQFADTNASRDHLICGYDNNPTVRPQTPKERDDRTIFAQKLVGSLQKHGIDHSVRCSLVKSEDTFFDKSLGMEITLRIDEGNIAALRSITKNPEPTSQPRSHDAKSAIDFPLKFLKRCECPHP